LKEADRRRADVLKFTDHLVNIPVIGFCFTGIVIFFEARKGKLFPASNTECAIVIDPLAVNNVIKNILDGPLARRIAE